MLRNRKQRRHAWLSQVTFCDGCGGACTPECRVQQTRERHRDLVFRVTGLGVL